MHSTKEKIILTAKELFDEHGMANVRLLQIADAVGISVGNLTYHFKNKEYIVEAVMSMLMDDLKDILTQYRSYPTLLDWNHQLSLLESFADSHPNFYKDYIEVLKSWPDSPILNNPPFKKILLQTRKRFEYNVERGIIYQEEYAGQHHKLAQTITQLVIGRSLSHQVLSLCAPTVDISIKQQVWNLILPLLTEEGRSEYQYIVEPLLTE